MSDFNDSGQLDSGQLDDNNDSFSNKRDFEAYDPFAAAPAPSAEPLFPTAPLVGWTEPGADGLGDSQENNSRSYYSQEYGRGLYASGEAHVDIDPALYALPTAAHTVPSTVPPTVEHTAETVEKQNSTFPDDSLPLNEAPVYDFTSLPPDEEPFPAAPKPALSEREVSLNRHFAVLMDMMQHGAWPQAVAKLQMMRAEFPEVKSLESLLDEAMLKTELMTQWADKIKGRRLTVGQEWLIRRSLPFLLLFALFISGVVFYQNFVAPSRQVLAMERANQALVEEATGLLQVGRIDEAITLYNQVLSSDPNNSAAEQGLVEANRLSGLAVTYDVAIRVANSGNLKRSLRMLQTVKAKSPSFRDIDARLTRVNSLLEAEAVYALAERAFAQRRWIDAIAYYEQTQLLAADYQAARIPLQLSAAYFMASQRLMTQWPMPEFGTQQIRDFLRRSQELNGHDQNVGDFVTHLDDFIRGERELNNSNLSEAVEVWQTLYEAQPNFMGGYLAEQLYRAYLALAAEVSMGDPQYAKELYTRAAAMPVQDSSEARTQLQSLGASIPAAQPTATPVPTVAYVAAVVQAAPPATPAPEPEPTATPTPANSYQGWIAFRTTRSGAEEIFVMRGDGSEQQPAPEELRGRIDALYQDEQRAPDGRRAFVQAAPGRSDANIYIAGSDGVNSAMITNHNGDEYDPVWSRAGERIAFVANHTGNDEIWSMTPDGGEQRQLTFNNWEWDKHPTWSPDGSQIAFFSNRSGKRQIWVMGSDGSAQRNLSNNTYDDWDPVWIK